MLKTLIVRVNSFNQYDDFQNFLDKTSLNIVYSLFEYNGNPADAFIVTDSREVADEGKERGIGYVVYLNDDNDSSEFADSLYCMDNISITEDEALVKMYERANDIPWTILETDRCIVREMKEDDIDSMYELYEDSLIKDKVEPLYESHQRELMYIREYIVNQYRFFEYGMWLVFDKESGELIGRAGISDRQGFDEKEIGYLFKESHRGKGIAFEVMSAILDYAKYNLGIEKLYCFTKMDNIKSMKLLSRLSFINRGLVEIEGQDYGFYDKLL